MSLSSEQVEGLQREQSLLCLHCHQRRLSQQPVKGGQDPHFPAPLSPSSCSSRRQSRLEAVKAEG